MPDKPMTENTPIPANSPAGDNQQPTDVLPEDNLDAILENLRGGRLGLAGIDGRDVSIVYIDRSRVTNNIGGSAETWAGQAVHQPHPRVGDAVLNLLPRWEVDRLAHVFVPPTGYAEALRRLRGEGILVLHGLPGTGKRAAAIHLLSQVSAGDTVVYELNPDVRLAELRVEDLPLNSRLLLETPAGSALENLSRFQIDALSQTLAQEICQGALVVVTNRLPRGFPTEVMAKTWAWELHWEDGTADAQRAIVRLHLEYLIANDIAVKVTENSLLSLLNHPSVVSMLAEPAPPEALNDLAGLLLTVLSGTQTVEDALARWSHHAIQQVARWFAEEHPSDLEDLLVAAAIFNGAPYTDVNEAAQRLAKYLNPESDGEAEATPATNRSRFTRQDPRQVRLERIHAQLKTTTITGHYGEVQEQAVVLKNPAWQKAVLQYVWEYDEVRQPLLDWLTIYGIHGNHAMRTRAAAAIGALGRSNFNTVEAQVLRTWADSPDSNTRRSAAQVLGITIWDEGAGAASARLLHYWASQQNKPRWQWTAATAYAGLAGLAYPQQALADLRLIAANTRQNPTLLEPIFRALVNAYGAAQASPESRLAILEALENWSAPVAKREEQDNSFILRRTAALGLCVMLWPDSRDTVWSLLLADIGMPGTAQDLAVTLMRRSLNFRQPRGSVADSLQPRKLALEALETLIRQVNLQGSPDQKADLGEFLAALSATCRAEDEDELDRLRDAATQWKEKEEQTNEFIEMLLGS